MPRRRSSIDARDGSVILSKDPRERRAIASTTKLMTALLALERPSPSDVFTAPAYNALPVESKINLRAGERMRVDDLLEALLLESANDAAVTIAEGVSGSRRRFVAAMNARAPVARARGHQLREPDRARRPAELLHGARPGRAGPAAARATGASRGSWTSPPPCSSRGRAGGWWTTATTWSAALPSSTA